MNDWKGRCDFPQQMEHEGFGRFKLFEVSCGYPPNYRGETYKYSFYEVRDADAPREVLKTFHSLQAARNYAGKLFKEDELKDESQD